MRSLSTLTALTLTSLSTLFTQDLEADCSHPPPLPAPQVLRAVVDSPAISVTFHDTQEHFALLYLWRVAKRFEEVGEDTVS